jgi:drug/metabolite transporter (DMT)-like permease
MSPRAWAAFAAVSTLWGMPYFFIKIAIDDGMSPIFLSWARAVIGAAVLLAFAWHAGVLGSLRGRWRAIGGYALLEITFPFPLIAAGERHVSSSLAAIIIASVPLMVALLALRFDHTERVRGSRLVGLLIGLSGVAALVGIDVAGKPDELLGAALVLVAAFGYAAGPMLLRRKLSDLDPRATMGASVAIAAILLTPAALFTAPAETPPGESLAAIVVLGLFCTATALVLFGALVAEVGAGRALVVTYINPLVAVALGVTILGERPGTGAVAGLLLILAGSWLATGGRLPPSGRAAFRRARSSRPPRRRPGSPGSSPSTAPRAPESPPAPPAPRTTAGSPPGRGPAAASS